MIAKIGEREVDWKDLIGGGSSPNACIRLEVHLINSKDAAIYLTCVPLSLEEVKELAERWECDILSDRIPVTVLHTGSGQNIKRTSIMAKIMVLGLRMILLKNNQLKDQNIDQGQWTS